MSEWEYEAGIADNYYVAVEAYGGSGEKASLSVNPIGQFSPGGCTALVYVKKETLLSLSAPEELMSCLLKKICFENLETAIDLDDFSLGHVLEYTAALEIDEENDWWLPYFKRLEKKVSAFREDLEKINEIRKIVIHQYHDAAGELCDFVDYTCCPEGEDNESIRCFLEENLSKESDIDAIMDCFEDGYFYGNAYESDRVIEADLAEQKVKEWLTISEIH